MRLLGALLVLLACGAAGMLLARSLALRRETLRELQVALQLLETEISFTATPLPEALRRVAEKTRTPTRRLFATASQMLRSTPGAAVSQAWDRGLGVLAAAAPLEERDLAVLSDLGQGLGQGDKADQIGKLELAKAQLRQLEEEASEESRRQARLWQTLGFLGGLALIILLY